MNKYRQTEEAALTEWFLNDYFDSLQWSYSNKDTINIVYGNIRAYHKFLYDNGFLDNTNIIEYAAIEKTKAILKTNN